MPILFVLITATLSSGADSVPGEEVCLVQHLISKGKLSDIFKSLEPPALACQLTLPLTFKMLKSAIVSQIQDEVPQHADCLITEFKNREAMDHLIKIRALSRTEVLNRTEQATAFAAATYDFKTVLDQIATACEADNKQLFGIFNDFMRFKNRSDQHYCLTKYAVDHNLLLLENVQVNPHRIDTDSVDCYQIVEVERNRKEMELSSALNQSNSDVLVKNCIMQVFRNDNRFDLDAHHVAINYLSISAEEKQVESKRIEDKLAEIRSKVLICTI